jgi:hypothetical protein
MIQWFQQRQAAPASTLSHIANNPAVPKKKIDMPDQKSKPVALLIYAQTGEELKSLETETEAIGSHLRASNLCDIRVVPAAT